MQCEGLPDYRNTNSFIECYKTSIFKVVRASLHGTGLALYYGLDQATFLFNFPVREYPPMDTVSHIRVYINNLCKTMSNLHHSTQLSSSTVLVK